MARGCGSGPCRQLLLVPPPMGRILILIGLLIAGAGLLITLGVPIGRLPGDISVRRGNFSFYFPLATSIIISILLTLLLMFFGRR